MPRLPVILLSGFIGAGKTSLLNQILMQAGAERVAVIVNESSELSFDTPSIRAGRTTLSSEREHLLQFHNGCICCTLRDEFLEQLEALAQSGRFDYVVVEASGIAEPLPVATALTALEPSELDLSESVRLDTLVTVVDAYHFLRDWELAQELSELGIAATPDDTRTLADLLAEQVEFANVIVLNKTDLVSEEDCTLLERLLKRLNPQARIVSTMYGLVPRDAIVGTGLFDQQMNQRVSLWQGLIDDAQTAAVDELGVSSFVYRARRPFHPERLWELFHEDWPGVLRSKGVFWLATRMNALGIWSQAGSVCSHQGAGRWWASIPEDEWPTESDMREEIQSDFEGPYGDRRQELVLIGADMDEPGMRRRLDACLLDEHEMLIGPVGWAQLADPFPAWSEDALEPEQLLVPSRRSIPSA